MIDIKIFHFHLYKNAGTSVDEILKSSFNNKWQEREFEDDNPLSDITDWVVSAPDTLCFSSHTASLKIITEQHLCDKDNRVFELFPIIFMRHPIDRIASVYRYEKSQTTNSWENNLAKSSSMQKYIETRWARELDTQCRNFHCNRLAEVFRNGDNTRISDYELALNSIKIFPFIGIVDRFQDSLNIYADLLKLFIDMDFHFLETIENATSDAGITLEDRLDLIKLEVGVSFFNKLIEINEKDISLYETVSNKLKLQYAHFTQWCD